MKKIILLLIVINFSSCRYFNVSPVNGITTKNITEKPLSKDLLGTWLIDIYSYDLLRKKGYEYKKVELSIRNDGSFEAKNLPDFINVFSKKNTKEYTTSKGTWEIAKDFDGENWVLQLKFEKSDFYKEDFSTEFDLYLEEDKLILWFFVGDPDSGERLLFKKE